MHDNHFPLLADSVNAIRDNEEATAHARDAIAGIDASLRRSRTAIDATQELLDRSALPSAGLFGYRSLVIPLGVIPAMRHYHGIHALVPCNT